MEIDCFLYIEKEDEKIEKIRKRFKAKKKQKNLDSLRLRVVKPVIKLRDVNEFRKHEVVNSSIDQ